MNKKVLIIEDDRNLAETLKGIFTKKNMDVKVKFSAQHAEHFISLEQYDLLIVDVVLPKVNGIDFLKKIIHKGMLHSSCKVWIISGVLSEKIISKEMVNYVNGFFKKPLNLNSIEEKIDTLFTVSDISSNSLHFFYLDPKNKKYFIENHEYIIKGHELFFIYFYLCSIHFSGMLKIICQGSEKEAEVLFKSGSIINLKAQSSQAYLEMLLVKNKLVSKADIKKLLEEKSEGTLGDRLVEGCYISPHQLDKILKEQIAIRSFKFMGYSSIIVSCESDVPSIPANQDIGLDMKNLLSLINSWISIKVDVQWLKEFFNKNKNLHVSFLNRFVHAQRLSRYPGLDFLASPIQEQKTVSDILNSSSQTKDKAVCDLYCRLLVKENCLEDEASSNAVPVDYRFMEEKYKTFLKSKTTKNYFELMNLPLNASINQIEETYRNIVKIFHPDRRDSNMPKHLAEICDQCFFLIKHMYQTLSNPMEKQKYIEKLNSKEQSGIFVFKEAYLKGKRDLEMGSYAQAIQQFKVVLNSKDAPGDTVLYYIWSKIKSKTSKLSKIEQDKISNLFDKLGAEHKESAVFFFVKGLFMKSKGDRKSAYSLFTKAFLLDAKLTVARVEKHSLDVRNKNKKSFISLFKKSV